MPQKEMPWIRQDMLRLPDQPPIRLGSQAWFDWLSRTSAFCYQPPGATDRLTLRKEKRRQHFYWYAYLKRDAKLHNAYVGKTQSLTPARLQQVFASLMAKVRCQRQTFRDG
jgi:hypothetical protein